MRALLRRCLERDPKQRLRDIGEARIALQEPDAAAAPGSVAPSRGGRRTALLLTAVALVAAALTAAVFVLRRGPAPEPMVFSLPAPPETRLQPGRGLP